MPDLPSLYEEWPDAGHEAIRLTVVQAIADIAGHAEGLEDSFLLGQTAADFAQTVLTNFTALQELVAAQQQQIADLTVRVAALEPPPDDPAPVPDPTIDPTGA